ncbi:MAG TPA: hypothetical protein VF807_15100, partial [Ktedonobacterales bacterium]
MSEQHDPRREPLDAPIESLTHREAPTPAAEPTRRLSARARLLRGAGIVLAVVVAAVALLPRAGVSLPEIVARALTPAPTATPHAGVLAMGSWQAIALPPTAGALQVVPSPKDPDIVYACATPGAQAPSRVPAAASIITVWTTHNAGASWQPLLATTGTGCFLQVARDD